MKIKFIILAVILISIFTQVYFVYFHNNPGVGSQSDLTSIKLSSDSMNLEQLALGTTKSCTFKIENKGSHPLIVYTVKTSCGCTVAKYDKKPILSGEKTIITLIFKPNSLGYFHKTADVVCNVLEGFVRLKISGEVVEQ